MLLILLPPEVNLFVYPMPLNQLIAASVACSVLAYGTSVTAAVVSGARLCSEKALPARRYYHTTLLQAGRPSKVVVLL